MSEGVPTVLLTANSHPRILPQRGVGMKEVTFTFDAKDKTTLLEHYWETCVGSCHGYTALREDYRQQLKEAHEQLGFRYVRFHGILDDDMCVVQKDGNVYRYNFVNIDNIFDFLLGIGMKPFMEISFMPEVFASGTTTLFHYKANNTMPKDLAEWDRFIESMVRHFIDRYGIEEVRTWFFEVWNEPNLHFFFNGTKEDYFRLYEHTARAIKKLDEGLSVGGPATALNAWVPDLIQFCETNGVPLDFISTHHYPTDEPLWRSGKSIEEFYEDVRKKEQAGDTEAMENARRYHRGILTEMIRRTRSEAGDYPLYYSEWNTSSVNGDKVHDEPYSSAAIVKTVLDNIGYIKGYSFWTFTDIFEEAPQKIGEFHGGFGLQTIHGIKKPSYRAFELLHALGDRMYPEPAEQNNCGAAFANGRSGGYCLILYNHQIPEEPNEDEMVTVTIDHLNIHSALLYRIDETHANARKAWEDMGEPIYPDQYSLQVLHESSALKAEPIEFLKDGDAVTMKLLLPKDGTALIRMA